MYRQDYRDRHAAAPAVATTAATERPRVAAGGRPPAPVASKSQPECGKPLKARVEPQALLRLG
jgi:hypothetical protein